MMESANSILTISTIAFTDIHKQKSREWCIHVHQSLTGIDIGLYSIDIDPDDSDIKSNSSIKSYLFDRHHISRALTRMFKAY